MIKSVVQSRNCKASFTIEYSEQHGSDKIGGRDKGRLKLLGREEVQLTEKVQLTS